MRSRAAGGNVRGAGQDGGMPARTSARSGAPPRARAAGGVGTPSGPAAEASAGNDPLAGFSALTREWFTGAFAEPTAAQAGAWASIAGGDNTLVIAPTGSGKTLAAFLWALDRLAGGPLPADPKLRCRVLYISPLKALAVDIERNLRAPLAGIRQIAQRRGLPEPDIRVAVRTGDTGADERRRLSTKPPDILITTPESLFLILTSKARDSLRGVDTVIVDEVHALAGNKRGAHLAISLERLDALRDAAGPDEPGQDGGGSAGPAQRIGLSATVRPPEEVATFLGGARPVTIAAPPYVKQMELRIVVPVEDMTDPDPPPASLRPASGAPGDGAPAGEPGLREAAQGQRSIWPHVEERVLDLIEAHRSTIVFANSRRLAERLCGRLNELAADRAQARDEAAAGLDGPGGPGPGGPPAQIMAQSGASAGAPAEVARAHHGSVSRQERAQIEEALKAGRLPAVVATSSLELGIDMGAVDLVIQVESAPSVASGLQRTGRAGHRVGDVSRSVIFPKYPGDLVEATVVTQRMRDEEFEELRPRLIWDRTSGTLRGRPGAQRLAVTSGGTIPDRGLFGVFLAGPQRQGKNSHRVGELDEEMVYESRVGDVFVLGASSWRIEDITADQVIVSPAPGQPGKLPFWHGDTPGRPAELGRAIGEYCRELSAADPERATARLRGDGLDELATTNLLTYLASQREATGYLPDDRTLVLERFRDELGDWRLVLHSPYGAKVHAPWALAIAARLRERYGGMDVQAMYTDDGIVIRVPDSDDPPPAGFALLDPDDVEQLVTAELGSSALFASRFRECAARALLLPRRQPGRRSPLWQQRQRSAQLLAVASGYGSFPIVLETMRECLQDVFDVPALTGLMRDLSGRRIRLVEVETATGSPFARSLLFRYIGAFMYEGDAPLAERRAQALTLDSALLAELLGQADLRELLDAQIVAESQRDLQRLSPGRQCSSAEQLADLIMGIGPLSAAEIAERCRDAGAAPAWIAELAAQRRIIEVRISGEQRLAAIEDAGRLRDALGAALPTGIPVAFTELLPDPLGDLVARYARSHGPFTAAEVAHRYGLGIAVVTGMLHRLTADGRIVEGEFLPSLAGPQWCDAAMLRMLKRRCLARLRQEAEPVPAEVLAAFLPAWQDALHDAAAGPGAQGLPGAGSRQGRRRARQPGPDAVYSVVEELAGETVPAAALESLILPARVEGYAPAMLDELTAAGDVVWAGAGALPGGDGWLVLAPAESAPLLLPPPGEITMTPVHETVLAVLGGGGALFFRGLADRVVDRVTAQHAEIGPAAVLETADGTTAAARTTPSRTRDGPEAATRAASRVRALSRVSDQAVAAAIWDLVWAGLLTNDTLAPLRTVLGPRKSWAPGPNPGPAAEPAGPADGLAAGGSRAAGAPGGQPPFAAGLGRPGGRLSARRPGFGRGSLPSHAGPPTVSGRWSLLPPADPDPTRRLHARALSLLDRHGIVIRGVAAAERVPGGFGALYQVLRAMEETGQCRRGYFVEGLGAAQFALPGAVDRMRAMADSVLMSPTGHADGGQAAPADAPWLTAGAPVGQAALPSAPWPVPGSSPAAGRTGTEPAVVVLAAADPANAYGAALPWPPRPDETAGGHRPGRKAGALVILVAGRLVLYVERGGKTLLSWTDDPVLLEPATAALAGAVRAGALGRLTVERADGGGVYDSPLAHALEAAGFRPTPRGLRLRG